MAEKTNLASNKEKGQIGNIYSVSLRMKPGTVYNGKKRRVRDRTDFSSYIQSARLDTSKKGRGKNVCIQFARLDTSKKEGGKMPVSNLPYWTQRKIFEKIPNQISSVYTAFILSSAFHFHTYHRKLNIIDRNKYRVYRFLDRT